jgi:hypothetical protein
MQVDKYFGKYRGFVQHNDDPQQRGRLRLEVPEVLQDNITDWANPCFPYAGNDVGVMFIPEEGDMVWVEFEGGDPNKPIWVGGPVGNPGGDSEAPDDVKDNYPDTHIMKTDSGHHIRFVDSDDDPRVEIEHSSGSRQVFYNADSASGSLLMEILGDLTANANGNIELTSQGNVAIASGLVMQIDSTGGIAINSDTQDISLTTGTNISLTSGTSIDMNSNTTTTIESLAKMEFSSDTVAELSANTSITLESQTITLDGTDITLDGTNITLNGTTVSLGSNSASESVVKGNSLVSLLNQMATTFDGHSHSSLGVQPNNPVMATKVSSQSSSILSTIVKTG